MEHETIRVRGAREHNLRNVSIELPRHALICFTGVSGSGKSSLAFDTLYAEGQRRYIESLSAYARQFMGTLAKPDVDQITGLSPAVAIQQKSTGWNPRSTVGTVTGIYDFLRVLYARAGRQHCPKCGQRISAQTAEAIVGRILALPADSRVLILAPIVRGQKGEHVDLLEDLRRRGYVRARIDGQVVHLEQAPKLGRHNRHDIEVVIDRLEIHEGIRSRLTEAVENALQLGDGTLIIAPAETTVRAKEPRASDSYKEPRASARADLPNGASPDHEGISARAKARGSLSYQDTTSHHPNSHHVPLTGDLLLSSRYACVDCGIGFDAPSPQLFSFNSPTGMCMACDGMGIRHDFDEKLLIPDPSLPFLAPCVVALKGKPGRWRQHLYRGVAQHLGIDLTLPWNKLPPKARHALLYGTGDTHITFEWRSFGRIWKHGGKYEGVIPELQSKFRQATSPILRAFYEKYMREGPCDICQGSRLNEQARAVRVGELALHQLCAMSVTRVREFISDLKLEPTEALIAAEVLKEVRARLEFLANVGLDYLTLDRTAPTLSGGESQRIRLAGQIGSGLVGVLYVLDEPSIGLHPRDNMKLLASLQKLRDMGNTVLVVEHDEQTMRAADLIVDFGPGPGVRGGEIVATGTLAQIAASRKSLTGAYLTGARSIEVPRKRRPVDMQEVDSKANRESRNKTKKTRGLRTNTRGHG